MKPWKQIIFYDFDKNMSTELLMSIIDMCERSNARVRGIICDMGNHTLLSKLGVYSNQNYFFLNSVNPVRRIYIFPDVPHCLKNLRNHTLDYGMLVKETEYNLNLINKRRFWNAN